MQILVNISKKDYESIKKHDPIPTVADGVNAYNAILNGTPLTKGHGRLIDVEEVSKIANKTKDLHGAIWNAPTIIEADKEKEE